MYATKIMAAFLSNLILLCSHAQHTHEQTRITLQLYTPVNYYWIIVFFEMYNTPCDLWWSFDDYVCIYIDRTLHYNNNNMKNTPRFYTYR